ncbi:MAG: MMPL family transporter [Micrococcales bacterium]|nr:MMPL family transporter [Micrococcales bacterium]
MLGSLGRLVGRHPLVVALLWLLFVVGGMGAATGAFGNESLFARLHSGDPSVDGEAQAGRDLLSGGDSTFHTTMHLTSGVDLHSPVVWRAAGEGLRDLNGIDGVASAVNPMAFPKGVLDPQARPFIADGTPSSGGYLTVIRYDTGLTDAAQEEASAAVESRLERMDEAIIGARGRGESIATLVEAVTGQVERDLRFGEGIALPLSFVVMLVVFGGFVAAGMPILGAIAAIAGALLSLLGFSHVIELEASVVNVVTVLGLGLCIDYGLLVVSRYREELAHLMAAHGTRTPTTQLAIEATQRTLRTAGRTVLFSALTVAISLAGLLLFDAPLMRAFGAAGVSVVLVALIVAVTLVPALCRLGARRLMRGRSLEDGGSDGLFGRLARWVQRRPWLVILGTLATLVVLALPSLSLRMTSSGKELLPASAPSRVFFDDLERHYPAMSGPDVQVVTRSTPEQAREYAASLAGLPGVTDAPTVRTVRDGIQAVQLHTDGGPLDDPARGLVDRLRSDRPDFPTYVTGQAAGLSEFVDSMVRQAPLAVALIALTTLVLLFLMTGSIVVPVKALLLNVISLGASLGVLVWVFQQGHVEGLLGFSSVGAVESMVPLLALAFGFGLSMDYEVFLLSRIVELHERGVGNDRAVELGLQRSGRIITSAALLVVIVFSGFVFGQLLIIKQMGVALAVAVAIDATLVRMLLVPATMTVLGEWNWWAPRWLHRLHQRFGITEHHDLHSDNQGGHAPAPDHT